MHTIHAFIDRSLESKWFLAITASLSRTDAPRPGARAIYWLTVIVLTIGWGLLWQASGIN